jgi:hypothetical protein
MRLLLSRFDPKWSWERLIASQVWRHSFVKTLFVALPRKRLRLKFLGASFCSLDALSCLFVCLWHSFECDCFCHFSIQEDCLGKGCLLLKFGVILYSLGALSCFLAQLNAIAFVIFQDNVGKALLLKCSFTFFKVAVSDYVLKRSPRKVFLYSVDALSCLVALLNSISLIYFLVEYERRASTVIPNYMFMISTVHCITHFSQLRSSDSSSTKTLENIQQSAISTHRHGHTII